MAAKPEVKRIRWGERDAGQKMSMVMLVLVMIACDLFAAWSLVVDLGAGDWVRAGSAAVFVVIWSTWGFGFVRQLGIFDAR